MTNMKLLAYDIEASSLNGDFGIVLCVGFKWVGSGKVSVLNILDYPGKDLIAKEKNLLHDVSDVVITADAVLGHFSTYYDLPFLNTRLLYHRLPVLPPQISQIDSWKTARYRLKLRNNRLKTISEFLGTSEEKDAIKPEQWIRAMGGHGPSMDYIVEHCRKDVAVLEEVYQRLLPLIIDHPRRGGVIAGKTCPNCGADRLQKRGIHLTRTRRYQRFQCQKCGSWNRASVALEA
jgi:uncharacterized protein YprB with RNaseH-like and TPR domain